MDRMIVAALALAAIVGQTAASRAADLAGRGPSPGMAFGRFGPPPQPGLITNPFRGQFFSEPRRFDAYGYPVYGPIVTAAPNPLYAATGCPQLLQPIYDISGNFAGYSPVQACR